jgi:predicted lipoprotein with Yx(FWY)xxD motif
MKLNLVRIKQLFLLISMVALLIAMVACSSTPAPSPTLSPNPTTVPPPSSTTASPSTTPATTTSLPATSPTPPANPAPSYTVNISSKPNLGNFLVDSKGMTLYYFTKDVINKSTAVGPVLAAWPLFNPTGFVVPPTLNAADFSTITRDDGQKVATYKGWPLYYYAKDLAPGDILGEAVGGVWFVMKVPFYTLMLQTKADIGNYLVDAKGMTLYYFTKDSVGKSTATGTVLANWPLFNAENFVVISTLNAADFSTITRDDGLKVSTYKGWPLYYFINDKASGDTNGQALNGVWFVIDPAKFPPPSTPSPSPAPSGTAY